MCDGRVVVCFGDYAEEELGNDSFSSGGGGGTVISRSLLRGGGK